jgi:hypothetical protein
MSVVRIVPRGFPGITRIMTNVSVNTAQIVNTA